MKGKPSKKLAKDMNRPSEKENIKNATAYMKILSTH